MIKVALGMLAPCILAWWLWPKAQSRGGKTFGPAEQSKVNAPADGDAEDSGTRAAAPPAQHSIKSRAEKGFEPVSEQEKQQLLDAASTLLDPLSESRAKATRLLFKYGDRALHLFLDELKSPLSTTSLTEAKRRMSIVDTLGAAAASKPFVLQGLKDFVIHSIGFSKLSRIAKFDMLESFEYISAYDREFAIKFIRELDSPTYSRQFVNSFVVGLRRSGMEANAAVSLAHSLFKDLS